jgi:AbrB family looped-hinge helix DNA binding protein|nr:MAG: antitoxin [Bacteriophage sp.]
MAELARRIDALGRITIPKEIRKSMNLYEGCLCAISATQNGILIKNADDNLQKDLQFIIDKYISESGWSDAVLKLMEVQDEIEFEPENNREPGEY